MRQLIEYSVQYEAVVPDEYGYALAGLAAGLFCNRIQAKRIYGVAATHDSKALGLWRFAFQSYDVMCEAHSSLPSSLALDRTPATMSRGRGQRSLGVARSQATA